MLVVECTCVWRGWANNRQGVWKWNKHNLCCQVECGLGRGVQQWEGKREEQISIMHKRQTALEGRTNSGSHFWRWRNHLESWVDLKWPRISWGHFKTLNKDKTFTLTHTHLYTCMYTCMPSSDGRKPWSARSILQPGEWQTQMVMCGELRETRGYLVACLSSPVSPTLCFIVQNSGCPWKNQIKTTRLCPCKKGDNVCARAGNKVLSEGPGAGI